MALSEYIPLMKPGSTGRNVIVALLYFMLFPLVLMLLPFIVLYLVGTNRNGITEKIQQSSLGRLPGLSRGGWTAGFSAFIYVFIILAIIGAAAPSDESPSDGSAANPASPSEQPNVDADTSTPTSSNMGSKSSATPTATSTATATATPTATPTPEPTPLPDGESYSYSGSGQTATQSFRASGGLVTIDLSHSGERNFIVKLVNTDTGNEKYLVNVIGNFDGQVATNVPEGNYVLDIQADGSWEAGVNQPRYSQAEVSNLPQSADETDFQVLGPIQFNGATRLEIDAETDRNVIVSLLDEDGNVVDLLVNEIGPHEGSTVFTANGVGHIYVETEGDWTVTVKKA